MLFSSLSLRKQNQRGSKRRRTAIAVTAAVGSLLAAGTVSAYVDLVGPGTLPNPNVNSVQGACPAGSSAVLFSTSGATSSGGVRVKSEQGYTLTWTESTSNVTGDAANDFILEIVSVALGATPVAYSRVFVFVGGNDTFSGNFNLAQFSSTGTDALVQANNPNGLNITQFGFCLYQAFGGLTINKVVPTPLGSTGFTIHYKCTLGTVTVAEGDMTFADTGGSQTVTGIPTGNNPPPSTTCVITEPGVNTALYTPVLPGTVTLVTGQNTTATVTNNPNTGTLTIIKHVINDDGGTAVAANFTMLPGGTAGGSVTGTESPGVTTTYVAGTTFDVTETGPAGYTASLSGDCSGSIDVGENNVCTVTNNDNPAHLKLIKVVTKDNGGAAVAADWTLAAAGPSPIFGPGGAEADVDAGVYTLSETDGPAGYAASSWGCVGGSLVGNELTLALGDNAVCTITNDDNAPSLTLVKRVINDNGGTAVAGDWTLGATGYDIVSPDAGTYPLTESGPGGYALTSLTCSNTGTTEVTSVTLGLGENVTCTFVNDDQAPRLTLVKEVRNNNGGTAVASDWTLTATGYSAATPQVGTYALSESVGPAGYTMTSLTCSNTGTTEVTSVTLGLGENVTCTFVNEDNAPSLTLVKEVITDNGGTAVASDWTLTATGYNAADTADWYLRPVGVCWACWVHDDLVDLFEHRYHRGDLGDPRSRRERDLHLRQQR